LAVRIIRLTVLPWGAYLPACGQFSLDTGPMAKGATMIVTTGNEVAGYSIVSYLGIVRGIVVRSPNIAQGFLGGLKQIIGGNIESYAQVCETARQEAYTRMVQHARERGADAVIAMRYDATEFASGVTEVLAYGTAVKLAPSAG
jgi:uncharacterized protein YbjQ (UPF0145 family)